MAEPSARRKLTSRRDSGIIGVAPGENLRLLCPNCNSQTPTFCGKNVGQSFGSSLMVEHRTLDAKVEVRVLAAEP